MLDVKELLQRLKMDLAVTEKQKTKILHTRGVNDEVINYLKDKLSNLTIELDNDCDFSLFDLMSQGKLLGTCWQTTESAVVFLNDDDYVQRGRISLDYFEHPYYHHSWICFKFNGKEYVLDACLNILCTKEDYDRVFSPSVEACVPAKNVKEELIRQLTAPCEEEDWEDDNEKYFLSLSDYGIKVIRKRKNEVFVNWSNEIDDPLYENGSGYIANIEENKIMKLIFHHF